MPLERIMKEKISADHLLYVSMKYTKTCDVMLNLIARWQSMIEMAADALLDKAKRQRKIRVIPIAPRIKIEALKGIFKKELDVLQALEIYEFFKRIPTSEKLRESEFRKNVCLTITDRGEEIRIDMDKLKQYSEILEKFIKFVRGYL